jgi:ferredoxin
MSARALVIDAADPPLGAAERVTAIAAAEAVLRGLGERALDHPRARLWIEAAAEDAAAALGDAAQRLGAAVSVRTATPAEPHTLRLRPTALAERVWRARGQERLAIAVAGAVGMPRVFVAAPETTVQDLVGRASPSTRAWVALWGGAAGQLVDRARSIGELDHHAARLLLVLPAGHALVRRARLPLSTWLRRAQSACAACAMCAPACPESIAVPELLRVLAAGTRARATTRLLAAADCTACGACDLACPQAISPARVVDDLGRRLRTGGAVAPRRRRRRARALGAEHAAARLGLARYTRAIPPELVLL